jgi:hypothetical protein
MISEIDYDFPVSQSVAGMQSEKETSRVRCVDSNLFEFIELLVHHPQVFISQQLLLITRDSANFGDVIEMLEALDAKNRYSGYHVVMLLSVGITPILLIIVLLTPMSFIVDVRSAAGSLNTVSVWSRITIQNADAYSTIYEQPPEDCMRPKWVKCFSIQQNFWISDSKGVPVLWAQNVIDLAKFNATYYGTYSFEAWTVKELMPKLCEPESDNVTLCRAPYYENAVTFPNSLTFYAHVSNLGSVSILHMSNDFGSVDWDIPDLINCPCFIDTLRSDRLPWGYSPFEFVAVGIDSLALAIFGNETIGTFGPILAQSTDGVWHAATVATLRCSFVGECPTRPGTGEASMNMQWNSTSGIFRWVLGASDQGVYINGFSDSEIIPTLPNPPPVEYMYARLDITVGFLTVFDEHSKVLGFDSLSGQWVKQIPNSTIIFSRNTEEIVVVNPERIYTFVVTAGGNTLFHLFVSKSTNAVRLLASVMAEGTMKMGESRKFVLDSRNMQMKNEDTGFGNTIRTPDFDLISLLTLWGVSILAILVVLRRRARKHPED